MMAVVLSVAVASITFFSLNLSFDDFDPHFKGH